MANRCDDTFQRLQEIEQQRRRIEADQADLHRAMAGLQRQMRNVDADGLDEFVARLDSATLRDSIADGFEQGLRTNLAAGDPNNYRQLLKRFGDIRTASDYAAFQKALLQTDRKLAPEEWKFLSEAYDNERLADMLMAAYTGLDDKDRLVRMIQDSSAFAGLVERMTRLKAAHLTFRQGFRDALDTIRQQLLATGTTTNGAKAEAMQRFKLALMGERAYDFARRRTGQTLRSLQGPIDDAAIPAVRADIDDLEARFGSDFDAAGAEAQEALQIKPEDLSPTNDTALMAWLIKALDEAKTNAPKAAKKIQTMQLLLDLDGLDPAGRMGKADWWNHQMKLANLLAKDSQLFNDATQIRTNLGSNTAMAIVGPYRQAYENVDALVETWGTQNTRRAFYEGFLSAWNGTRAAMHKVRVGGREAFMDSLNEGTHHFAMNKDLMWKVQSREHLQHGNAHILARYERLMDMQVPKGMARGGSDIALYRGKLQAALRIWMYDKFGDKAKWVLQPGVRLMTAIDNVAGLYHYSFKLRNSIEMKYRLRGMDPATPAVQKMIDAEFEQGFYSHAPTEAEIKYFRKQEQLGAEVTDDEIVAEIAAKRMHNTYGAQVLETPEAIDAEKWSQEMRMQDQPEGDGIVTATWNAAQRLRQRWEGDFAIPYFQSPIMGLARDMAFSGVSPVIDLARVMAGGDVSPAAIRRAKANLIISGHLLAAFAAAETIDPDFIIGGGPVDPKERQEWLMDLNRRGLRPNSIGGIPMLGGIPLLNTLFLYKDIKDTWMDGSRSEADGNKVLEGILRVMAGQLQRQTAFGQLHQLMELFIEPDNPNKLRLVSYLAAGQVPGIGAIRSAGRLGQMGPQRAPYASGAYYESNPPGFEEQQATGTTGSWIDEGIGALRSLLNDGMRLSAIYGAPKKELDWLGSPINLPWGMNYLQALTWRFRPALWPADKVYAELDAQNMLEPPTPLRTRVLEGVAMSDRLQKLYNDTYGQLKGDSISGRFAQAGQGVSITLRLPQRISLPDGSTVNRDKTVSVPVTALLEQHVQGNTVLEALHSLMESDLYKAMEASSLSADLTRNDMTPAERRRRPAQQMIQAIKNYYHLETTDALGRSDDPEAIRWRETRQALDNRAVELFGEQMPELGPILTQ